MQPETPILFWTAIRQGVRYSEVSKGDLDVFVQIKKKKQQHKHSPVISEFPHFPRRRFCRSCQHFTQWSCKWYCLCCCQTALTTRCCPLHVFIISASPIKQSIFFCCFPVEKKNKKNLFSSFLRLNNNNRPRDIWTFWIITNTRRSQIVAEFLSFESKLIVWACLIQTHHSDHSNLSTLIVLYCPSLVTCPLFKHVATM